MRIGVTGASGYIGSALAARALRAGDTVVSLGRHPLQSSIEHRSADLEAAVPEDLLDGLDAVIHLAANTGGQGATPVQELAFARGLAAQAATRGCRLVFVSSQAASPTAPSDYGRTKAAIEADVLASGGVAARPGMVYGSMPAGLFGVLDAAVRKLPILPALHTPTPRVQPIHVDDLADGLLRLAADARWQGVVVLAGEPVSFTDFLAAIARARHGRKARFLPVPVPALRALLQLGGRLAGPRLSPERLDSLVQLPALEAGKDLAQLGLQLRPLEAGLVSSSVRRRGLLREAGRLARALIGRTPTPGLARRYARAASALGAAQPLPLPAWLGPALLSALDRRVDRNRGVPGDLAWRMAMLLRLAETEPRLADRFLRGDARVRRGWLLATLVAAAWLELRARLLWPLARLGVPRT